MWPNKKRPDPDGARRLVQLGCKVKYEKSEIVEPRKIRSPDDFRPGTKKGKLESRPIWVVTIAMPKKLVFDIFNSYMDRIREERKGDKPKAPPAAPAAGAPPAGAPPAGAPPAAPAGAPAGAPPV
jgi:hypothetical protein